MTVLGLENRIANEALDEDRRANKRVFKNEQKQVAVSGRVELPPTQIERRTVYEIDLAVSEINNILQTRIQAIQAPLQAQIPIDPNDPNAPNPAPPPAIPNQQAGQPLDIDLSPIIPLWNKIITIIDVYTKNNTAPATPADFKFISQKLKQIEPNIQMIILLIDNFVGNAPAGVIRGVRGYRQIKEIAQQIQNGVVYSKVSNVDNANNVIQNQGQLQGQIANMNAQINQNALLPQQQGQNLPPQAPLAGNVIPPLAPQAQIDALFTDANGGIDYAQLGNIIDVIKQMLRDNINPADMRQLNLDIKTREDAIRQNLGLRPRAMLDTNQARTDVYTSLLALRDYLAQNYNGFGDPNIPVANRGNPQQQQQQQQQGQQQAQGARALQAIKNQVVADIVRGIPNPRERPTTKQLAPYIMVAVRLMNQSLQNPPNRLENPLLDPQTGALDLNHFATAFSAPQQQDPIFGRFMNSIQQHPQVYIDALNLGFNAPNAPGAPPQGAPPPYATAPQQGDPIFQAIQDFILQTENQTATNLTSPNDIQAIEYYLQQTPIFAQLLALSQNDPQLARDSILQVMDDIRIQREGYAQRYGVQQQQLRGQGRATGGRNDRANSGSLFLGNRGRPTNPRKTPYGGSHPLSRLVGGAGVPPDFVDIGEEYPNIGLDPQYFRDPEMRPATNMENLWRTAGRAEAWARAGITTLAQFTRWMTINAIHYAQLILTDPRVISAAQKVGKSTADFVYENPAVALVYVLPPPLNTLAVATAIVGYLGRDWWRTNVGRGGAVGSLEQTHRLLYRGDMINNTANSMYPGYIDRYVATQVPDGGLSNPYYETPSFQQDYYMIGGAMFDSKGQQQPFLDRYKGFDPSKCMIPAVVMSEEKRQEYLDKCRAQQMKRSEIETPPQNVGLPNFMKINHMDNNMYLQDPEYNRFKTRGKLQGTSQPLFGMPLNVNSDRVMEQNSGKHFRALPIKDGKYIHRNKPYTNPELYNDADDEMYRGQEMERPNYGTAVMEETPKHRAMVDEMRAEDGFFAKKNAKKLGLKKDSAYFSNK